MLVFDASTLILLARIEILDLFLAECSLDAVIPVKVESECCGAKKALDALLIQKAIQESRITAVEVRDRKFVAQLEVDFSLGRGEAEAIRLALLNKENLLAIDDKNGFNACKLLGIAFTTAANMLVRCREKDLLSSDEAPRKLTLSDRDWRQQIRKVWAIPKGDEHSHRSRYLQVC
jgi:predicted nucleic acid-binding protein